MKIIGFFNNLSKADSAIAGGKGASLGEMTQAGILVPPGFVVLTDAFERFLNEAALQRKIQTCLELIDPQESGGVNAASQYIQKIILNAAIPQDITDAILAGSRQLGAEYVAVRSSATAEDGVDASWAGELDSFLNTSKSALLDNVKHCWASLFSRRAIIYRFAKGFHESKVSVAVVVQKMVNSEVSGVAFSVHPITQDPNQLIIEAGFGLGESIVSGSVTPDSYVVQKSDWQVIERYVSNQTKKLIKADAGGSNWIDVPADISSKQKLGKEKILELAKLVSHIEQYNGFPCDIEWALENNELFIVQSRPITTLTGPIENKKDRLSLVGSVQWKKVLQRNIPPLGWSAGAYYEFHGLNIGALYWIRERGIQIKYKTVQSYVVLDPTSYYKSNISEIIQTQNDDFEIALDLANQQIFDAVRVMPGSTRDDMAKLSELHKLAWGYMLLALDVAGDIKARIEKVMSHLLPALDDYLATPWKQTAIERERQAIGQVKTNPTPENIMQLAIDYGFIHQDYLGKAWTVQDYTLAVAEMNDSASHIAVNPEEVSLDAYQRWLVEIFRKIIYLYEEGRNAMVRCMWAIKETGGALENDPGHLLYATANELTRYAAGKENALPSTEVITYRKEAFALHFDKGIYHEFTGVTEVEALIAEQNLAHLWDAQPNSSTTLKGQVAFKGLVTGKVRLVFTQEDADKIEAGEILVAPMTQVEFLSGIHRCAAIVTDEGGVICHAAIVAREFGKPCILATGTASITFKTGDTIRVDANTGIVSLIH